MTLKKTEIPLFEMLQQTAKMIREDFMQPADAAEAKMLDQAEQFKLRTQHKIIHLKEPVNGQYLGLIDLRKDELKVNELSNYTRLRAVKSSVPIDIKLFKEGEYEYSNSLIILALKELISDISSLDVELSTLPESDILTMISDLDQNEEQGVVLDNNTTGSDSIGPILGAETEYPELNSDDTSQTTEPPRPMEPLWSASTSEGDS